MTRSASRNLQDSTSTSRVLLSRSDFETKNTQPISQVLNNAFSSAVRFDAPETASKRFGTLR